MVVLAFFSLHQEFENSDEERIGFAKEYLEGYRFLYKESDDDNKKVCNSECFLSIHIITNTSQKWKGLFHSMFVLQTFATHLKIIENSATIPDLHDKPTAAAVGGLGLAAASVCAIYFTFELFLTINRWRGLCV